MMQAAALAAGRWRFRRPGDAKPDENTEGRDQEERILLQAGREGDHTALERLLSRYEGELLRLCASILPHSHDAEDAVQETFLRFLRALPTYRGEAAVKTWLFRIALNLCLDWRRQQTRQGANHAVSLDAEAEESGLAATRANHQPSLEAATVTRLTIQAALDSLSPRQQTIFLLREREQWSSQEIGEMLGWSERKVQYELVKARQLLVRWQQEQKEGEETE